jgi:uncharacterized protein YdeI (YjbR/CyaY-like superfamily)
MNPTFFETQIAFRQWLQKNYKNQAELLVGFYNVKSGKKSMSWSQSVDEALCFGWIDGVRKNIDEYNYSIRFTPRRPNSIWSTININKIAELTKQGLMKPEGIAAFEKRTETKSNIYSHENEVKTFSTLHLNILMKNKTAWQFFSSQAPSYQKVIVHWVTTAKQEKTQLARLQKVIEASELQKRL